MEIEARTKLEKEMHNLSVLKETVSKSNQLTNGMCGILTSFEERLMKLERTILPVYHETGNLQRRQDNIQQTLESLDHVIQFYTIPKEVELVIRDGVSGKLKEFLECMEKLKKGVAFFSDIKPHDHELDELNSLFEAGGDALEREFRSLLTKYCKPVPHITILDLVGMDDELPQEDEKVLLEQIPEHVTRELVQIANWLRKNRNEDFANIYGSLRSATLQKSLHGLKEHQKSSSGSSTTLILHSSPMLGGRRNIARETPSRKASKRIQQALMKRASLAIMKYSPSVESTVLGQKLQTALLSEPRDEITDQEIEAYLTCITALYKLMQSEVQLMQGIIADDRQKFVFEKVVQHSLDSLIGEGDMLTSRVKKCIAKHDFSAVLALCPILRHLNAMKLEFELLFEGCSTSVRSKLPGMIVTVQTTISKSLEEFIDSIKNDPDTKMPRDGTVHELTSNVMMLLEQLQDFLDLMGTVVCIPDRSGYNSQRDPNKYYLAQYITRVLSALGLILQNKSEAYGDPYLKSVFRLNNYHYILRSLQRTGLLDIALLYNSDLELYYNDQIREQKRIYSQSWSRVLHYVMADTDRMLSSSLQPRAPLPGHRSSSFKMKDKERQSIKDKFTGFNKEMDDLYKTQKAYAIPDVELRESLKRDNKEYILPKYQSFYDKHLSIPFTKNPDKYLKYAPIQISNLIDKFFDAAA